MIAEISQLLNATGSAATAPEEVLARWIKWSAINAHAAAQGRTPGGRLGLKVSSRRRLSSSARRASSWARLSSSIA
jgi:hypothetical protein